MTNDAKNGRAVLFRRAEEILRRQRDASTVLSVGEIEMIKLIGEMQDSLKELENQHEELILNREQGELEFQKSEVKYRRIFESVQDVYFEAAIDGTLLEVSPSIEKITKGQYTRSEMLGKSFVGIYANPGERDAYYATLLEQKRVNDYELYLRNKDGSIIPAAVSSALYFDTGGQPYKITGILRDISDRKNAENRLKETLKQLNEANQTLENRVEERTRRIVEISSFQRAILANAPFSIMTINDEGIYQSINPFGEMMLGYTSLEIVGKLTPFAFHDRDELLKVCFETTGNQNPTDEEIYRSVLQFIFHKTTEWTWIRKNGERFPVRLTHRSIIDDNGTLQGYMGLIFDITQERLSVQSLRKSEAENRAILMAVPDLMFRIHRDGTYLDYHSQTDSLLYLPREFFVGKKIGEVIPPELAEQSMQVMEKAFSTRKVEQFEYKLTINEKDSYFENRLVAISEDEVLSIIREITESKRATVFGEELLQLSLQLTGIPVSEIPQAIDMALGRIGGFLGADRAYIFEIEQDGNTMSNTYEWCNEGITCEIENLKGIPCDILPSWMEKLRLQENIVITSVKDLPETWQAEREILEPQGIQSLVVIPMILENTLIGFVGLDSVLKKRDYKESEIKILKVWGNMLTGLIKHQRQENYLELMRKNYEAFFNTIDDFLFVLDTQGNTIHTNTTVPRRLGYESDELLNQSVLMVHPPERREEAGRIVGEMLAGTSEFCPVPLITKSGDYIPVETRVKPGFWDGKPAIFGVSKDISKIQLSEEKFSKAFQSNSALMAISTLEGRFIEVNDTFVKTLGYSRSEIIGKTSYDLRLFDGPCLRDQLAKELANDEGIREFELAVRTKSGDEIIGLFSADLITIGTESCFLTMLVDISDRKVAEAEILKAKSEAEKANLAKSEFLSRMSHELRTPMNSILGFAQLLEMGELNPKQRKGVRHILNNGKHLLDLINEVLDISGIEAGRQVLVPEPVHLEGIIQEVTESLQVAAFKRRISFLLIDSPVNQFFVYADKLRLRQVLINLFNNAIKYNKEGGSVTIETALRPKDERGNSPIRISITDTGNGINPENISKLFQPFERIGATRAETEGTGLGLVVVKKLVEAMNGRIGVESVVDEGSCFWIELPLSENSKLVTQQNTNLIATESTVRKSDITILYIEDNLPNIELVEEIMAEHRPEICLVVSTNGGQTLDLAKEHKPVLILLDLDLPDVQGAEVLDRLLVDEVTKDIPVIIVSADAMPFMVEKLMKAGATDYLTKPLDIVKYLKVIDMHTNM